MKNYMKEQINLNTTRTVFHRKLFRQMLDEALLNCFLSYFPPCSENLNLNVWKCSLIQSPKPSPGRVFYAEDTNVTFYEAGEQCAKLGGRLATTGELYLAWKEGMDVCSPGWLADHSLRYPINIANSLCGGGLVGVMTIDLDPDSTDARHDAVCFRGESFRVRNWWITTNAMHCVGRIQFHFY